MVKNLTLRQRSLVYEALSELERKLEINRRDYACDCTYAEDENGSPNYCRPIYTDRPEEKLDEDDKDHILAYETVLAVIRTLVI